MLLGGQWLLRVTEQFENTLHGDEFVTIRMLLDLNFVLIVYQMNRWK